MNGEFLHNPTLEGDAFVWEAGSTGVLLFHGFTATTAEMRPVATAFHDAGLTVSAPLLPGHGTRPQDLNRVRWQDWTSAAEAAYQDLAARCERVVVGGESMGAVVALGLAARHPDAGVKAYRAGRYADAIASFAGRMVRTVPSIAVWGPPSSFTLLSRPPCT